MADDKAGRDKQANDEERRQRERDMREARERGDEPEPVDPEVSEELDALDAALDDHDYPTTAAELIDAHGDRDIETQSGSMSVAEVLAEADDDESYESPDDVRNRIQGLIHR